MAHPIGTRCQPACHRPTGTQSHCTVCHRTLGGPSYFDDHRRDGRCLDPTQMGLAEQGGLWTTPEGHASRARATEQLAAMRGNRTGAAS
jgi:hypothetical protein